MLTFNTKRAWHPSLWPFYVLRSLVLWAAITGATVGALFAVFGGTAVILFMGPLWASFMVLAMGIIPAALLALLDVAFVGRRNRSPHRYAASRGRRRGAQSALDWALVGGAIGSGLFAAYSFVYLNAFAPTAGIDELLGIGLLAGAGFGLATGWLTALTFNATHSWAPGLTMADTIRRSAMIWIAVVTAAGAGLYIAYEASLEKTLLPTALMALIGAGVVPQLAATAPTDWARRQHPVPTAPSPSPIQLDGDWGEGARGDWRTAPPPQFPRQTPRPNADSTGSTTEVVNG